MSRIATLIATAGIAAVLGGAGAFALGASDAAPQPESTVVTQASDENGVRDDDGTADQGRGDAPGTAGAADDDGTADQGPGDAPGTAGAGDDDGTADQGPGDAPGTAGAADDDGTADQGPGDAPGTAERDRRPRR